MYRWIKKIWYIYTTEYYSVIKKERNNAICSNMEESRDYQTKWNKSDKERQISYDMAYIWNLKYGINEHIYETKTDTLTLKTNLWLPKWKWEKDKLGVWDSWIYITIYKIDKQQELL